jgi:hypothetical protein
MQAGPFNREKEKSIPQNGTCWPECRGLPRRQPSRAGTQDESALEKEVMFMLALPSHYLVVDSDSWSTEHYRVSIVYSGCDGTAA